MPDIPQDKTTMSNEDIEAMQIVRSAASIALDTAAISDHFRDRVRASVARVTQIIQREIGRAG